MSRPFRTASIVGVLALAILAVAATAHRTGAAHADAAPVQQDLVLGTDRGASPDSTNAFLTAVTQDIDRYWTGVFESSGLPEPRVSYAWIPAGQRAASACGDGSGTLGDDAAAYCPSDDTIYISERFAQDLYDGALNQVLPGSSQGYGRATGDFAVAYLVAHEYAHQIQDELGVFGPDGPRVPTMNVELQADCYAGAWAKSADRAHRLEEGDVDEALNAALAVGDFNADDPGHHGTPQQRAEAWSTGFDSGDPQSCADYLTAA